MNAIDIRGVSKTFGTHRAVNDVSLEVPEGSIYGFIGPNGSGKTTTIRMIMNIILPDRGEITVLGQPRYGRGARRRQLSARKSAASTNRCRCVGCCGTTAGSRDGSQRELDPVITQWLERLNLAAWADKRIDQLSKGMAQKVQFIAAVVSQPKLLILDEPFSGLDPVNAEALRDAVLELRRDGTTIVFSTHDMGAAEKLCDRIFMIFKGHKVLDGSLDAHSAAVRARHDSRAARRRRGRARGHAGHRERQRPRQLPGRAADGRSAGVPARPASSARRCCSSKSRSRRCTTSSCASRSPPAEDLRAAGEVA